MSAKYYAMIDGERKGPFSLEELPREGVRPSTYIWCKGMPDWQKAEDNADVCRLFRNHLYDVMHPSEEPKAKEENQLTVDDRWKVKPDDPKARKATSFDRILEQAGEEPLPTLEEIESRTDKSKPPLSMIGYAWLVTIFCCLPVGIFALVYAYKSRNAWKRGETELSYDYNRRAKMATGIAFFLGLIGYALFMALSM